MNGNPTSDGAGGSFSAKSVHVSGNTFIGDAVSFVMNADSANKVMFNDNMVDVASVGTKFINTTANTLKVQINGNFIPTGLTIDDSNVVASHNTNARTYNAGLASVVNAGTVAHGLEESPALVLVNCRESASNSLIVNATANATNIIFYINDNAGTPVTTATSVSWYALTWAEIRNLL